jgi:hypothetical protein
VVEDHLQVNPLEQVEQEILRLQVLLKVIQEEMQFLHLIHLLVVEELLLKDQML